MNYDILVSKEGLSPKEWLAWRQKGIEASDVPGILGISSNSSPLKVFQDKTAPISDDVTTILLNAKRQTSYPIEDYCTKRFGEITGKKIQKINAIIRHKIHPFIIGDPICCIEAEDAILQYNVLGSFFPNDENTSKFTAFNLKCHHDLIATGAKKCYLALLVISGMEFHMYEIERSEETMKYLLKKEMAFWSLVEAGTPPVQAG